MTQFIHSTINDMRGGRQSWRVLLSVSLPSFAISLILTAAQHIA